MYKACATGDLRYNSLYRQFALVLVIASAGSFRAAAASCDSLASLTLPGVTIQSAETVGAGEFTPPAAAGRGPAGNGFKDLPAFCRVSATLKPSKDSDIKVEVWLPQSGWNGKFLAAANGGQNGALQGEISFGALAAALRGGYASGGTDTGHEGPTLNFALEHPERLIDFGYRAFHEMTVQAKAITAAYYGDAPKYSYLNACAAGGREGLMEAQRYPRDYDGIVVGAPANNWIRLQTWSLWVYQSTHKDEASYIPPSKYPLLHKAAVEACDARDGVKDGVIEDPRRCKFDPKVLECGGEETSACLTKPQVEAARRIYAPAVNPRTHAVIFPGLEPGSELGWGGLADGAQAPLYVRETFKYVVFQDPNWDWKARPVDYDKDLALAENRDHGTLTTNRPDLKEFFAHGGKLIQYHGWSDPLIAPGDSINYYREVVSSVGRQAKDSIRLYLVPGMLHCRGGEGTDQFDLQTAVEQWVEQGKAPDQIVATRIVGGKAERTRPLCPYPQTAIYKGGGSSDEAANFICKNP